jgi:hypothetical protein
LRDAREGADQGHVLQLAKFILDQVLLQEVQLIFSQLDAALGHSVLELLLAKLLVTISVDCLKDLTDRYELITWPLVPLGDLIQDLVNRLQLLLLLKGQWIANVLKCL